MTGVHSLTPLKYVELAVAVVHAAGSSCPASGCGRAGTAENLVQDQGRKKHDLNRGTRTRVQNLGFPQ